MSKSTCYLATVALCLSCTISESIEAVSEIPKSRNDITELKSQFSMLEGELKGRTSFHPVPDLQRL